MQINNPFASFTRPATTPTYATGQMVANSATAGSVVPMAIVLGNAFGVGSLRLTRARLFKSSTTITNASFRIMFFQAAPTIASGDGAAFSTSGAANWLGNIDVTSMIAFTDGAAGTGSFPAGSEALLKLASGQTIYALLMAQAAYVGVSAESFTLVIEELDAY